MIYVHPLEGIDITVLPVPPGEQLKMDMIRELMDSSLVIPGFEDARRAIIDELYTP